MSLKIRMGEHLTQWKIMNKVNTKYCTSKTVKPDYQKRMTAQEANCDGIFTTSVPTMKVTGETVIDGKRYITLTV